MLPLIDIGVNLTHDSFDADRTAVIEHARAAGVTRIIVTGTSVTESAKALELARQWPGTLYATAGIHPHHASDWSAATPQALSALLADPLVVAVGECGLDYFRNFSPREAQQAAFAGHLELAAQVGKPVFLHQRDAHEDFLAILKPVRDRLVGGVAHCFTGGPEELRDYLDLGLYVGVTGWVCDERRGEALRHALRFVPLDRLMIETDAPYLMPRDLPQKPASRRNEPAFLPHVLARSASEMGLPSEKIAAAALENTERLFGLPALGSA
jgi:TatD DNase family protein